MKTMSSIRLIAVDKDRQPVKAQNWAHRVRLITSDGSMEVISTDGFRNVIQLRTQKGLYKLNKHQELNVFIGSCKGIKVHVSIKKMVGSIRYWA